MSVREPLLIRAFLSWSIDCKGRISELVFNFFRGQQADYSQSRADDLCCFSIAHCDPHPVNMADILRVDTPLADGIEQKNLFFFQN